MTTPGTVYYHGTRRGFSRGGWVFPRGFHTGAGTDAPRVAGRGEPDGADQWVYVTTDPVIAWVYAWHAPGRGRPKVLTVVPRGAVEPDVEHSPSMNAWRCESARVTAVSTDPLITEADARAGWVTT